MQKNLINATQHQQGDQPWEAIGVSFDEPNFCPYTAFNPKQPTRDQVVSAWRTLLAKLDASLAEGKTVDGFLLGGYAPAVLGLYQFLSQFRQTCYAAVMGPAPIVEGQRRSFVLQGIRRIPTPRTLRESITREGQPLPQEDANVPFSSTGFSLPHIPPQQMRTDRLVHVSARPLTDQRRGEIAMIAPQVLIPTTPALPPPADHDLADYMASVESIAKMAADERCGVFLDGPPAETILHLYAILGHQHPFFFAKTEVVVPGTPAQIVSIEKVPRF